MTSHPSAVMTYDLDSTDKAVTEHVDDKGMDVVEPEDPEKRASVDGIIVKSPFEDLPFNKTLKVFWKATLMALMVAFSAAAE